MPTRFALSLAHLRRSAMLASLLILAGPLRAETWVVAQDGTGDFTTIAKAVAWAAEGDAIWVRTGSYGTVIIDGKSVEIVASDLDEVYVHEIVIQNVDFGQEVALSGLSVIRDTKIDTELAALIVTDCSGSIRIQDTILGRFGQVSGVRHRGAGVSTVRVADIAFSHCEISGAAAGEYEWGVLAQEGLYMEDSTASLFDCLVQGPTTSKPGAKLMDANLFVSGCRIKGSGGGYVSCPSAPIDGGPGLVAEGLSVIHQLGGEIRGGAAGVAVGFGCYEEASPGPPMILGPLVSFNSLPGTPRNWTCDNVESEGGPFRVEYRGEAGDRVYVMRSHTGAHRLMPALGGVLLLLPPTNPAFLGVADATGELSVVLEPAPPQLTDPLGGFFLQAYAVDTTDNVRLAGSNHVAMVPASIAPDCSRVIYVDDDGSPTAGGTSWGDALPNLQAALELARENLAFCEIGAQIWIAEGTYSPDPSLPAGDPMVDVDFPVELFGGFAGTETTLGERDPAAHPTILTADVLGDDGPGYTNRSDNVNRILEVDIEHQGTFTLDSVVLTGAGYYGAANILAAGKLSIRGCTIADSYSSTYSFGLQAQASAIELTSCCLIDNQIGKGNVAHLRAPIIDITSCTFEGNRITDSTSSSHYQTLFLSPRQYESEVRTQVSNSMFRNNYAPRTAGIRCYIGPMGIADCTFVDNHTDQGPAALGILNSSVSVENSILWGNTSGTLSGEAAQLGPFDPNGAHLVHFQIDNSCIEGFTGKWPGSGSHGLDPLLSPDGHLGPGSPCIDAGDNALVPPDLDDLDGDGDLGEALPFDLDGNARFVDDPSVPDTGSGTPPVVDMGAFESPGP